MDPFCSCCLDLKPIDCNRTLMNLKEITEEETMNPFLQGNKASTSISFPAKLHSNEPNRALAKWACNCGRIGQSIWNQHPALDMDTSNPAVFVNAELLHMYVGRKVRAVIQVVQSDNGAVIGKSTDEKQLVVKGSPPLSLTTYVEVIGIAESNQSIRAEIWNNFGDTFVQAHHTIAPVMQRSEQRKS
ncbi:hypothetical protein HYC85_006896 [Camellia sinensis]|uniref:Uncharacterized protein n=1 Tax=Camellia sinensis TaxID=4442 RepID=A0A7J7HMG8_CAMSI|nr:hypothetical protein HYC85_006896 [Camellia sinensis]